MLNYLASKENLSTYSMDPSLSWILGDQLCPLLLLLAFLGWVLSSFSSFLVLHSHRFKVLPSPLRASQVAGAVVKNLPANSGDAGWIPGSGKIPWRRKWHPSPVFLPGESRRQRRLVGYSPWGRKRVGHNWTHAAYLTPNSLYLTPPSSYSPSLSISVTNSSISFMNLQWSLSPRLLPALTLQSQTTWKRLCF